jgi:O-acetyl-ADP-ribose deacetylase (regulator of RNase III)
MLEYRQGDVLNSGEKIVVHGCNCFNTMGSGIALQIKTQYPEAYEADCTTQKGDKNKLGTFTYAISNGVLIINAYTQYKYGRDKRYADYDAIETVIRKICQALPGQTIAMPRIGCGLAGGDWKIVSEIIERISEENNNTIHVYDWNKTTLW